MTNYNALFAQATFLKLNKAKPKDIGSLGIFASGLLH